MVDRAIIELEAAKLSDLFAIKKQEEKEKGRLFTQSNIAKVGGWTQPNVSAYLNGRVELKEDSAQVFSDALDVDIAAFSPRLAERISKREAISRNPLLNKQMRISYIPTIDAETMDSIRPRFKDKDFIMPTQPATTPVCLNLPENAFGYILEDDALEGINTKNIHSKNIHPKGTLFVINPEREPKPQDIVLVGNKNKPSDYHFRIYTVLEVTANDEVICSFEPINQNFPVLRENYEIIGVAVISQKSL
ncbi:hypothetical protein P255_02957 [Acinetobacter brisouii CIP 110357]|uniref:HTH cro/C1-type domain-containing protein n=1 Tax=Acinetobacter brisouii CIP 110357 TaxID=1341683 RepID=V2UFK9_9GAMM|nr:helix-turn-helix transcriptional regulator [Acinetobacter brisouii]ENV46210.1 hypothetical protein F954_02845 [Acinetobacter brisouii ANC 4119]ESK47475.1 hypothetical protein P255_02957 [Acinetobacter brisouii CIP 110357]